MGEEILPKAVSACSQAYARDPQNPRLQAGQLTNQGSFYSHKYAFPSAMPTLPSLAVVTPGSTSVTVASGATRILTPGSYGAVTVAYQGVLRLQGGVFHLASLQLDDETRIEALAAVQIRVAGRLSTLARVHIGAASGVTLAAGDVRIEVSGRNGSGGTLAETPKAALFGDDLTLQAVMLVPNGTLSIGQRAALTGAFVGQDVFIDIDSVTTYQSGMGSLLCSPTSCDDSNPCTADSCANGICVHTPVAAGTSCSDGNACNGAEVCDGAAHCQAGSPVVCTASDQCHTEGTCNQTTGVCSNPAKANGTVCNDGNACTQSDTCQSGTCTGANPVVCTASDQCHVAGTCDSATGQCSSPAQPNGTSCDDANPCTKTDVCTVGVCGGTVYTCDDGKTCTADSCNGDGTCAFSVTAGNCLVDGTCYASATTNPGNQCEQCAPETSKTAWSPKSGGTACDDGNACTKGDVCNGASLCGGTAYTCSDGLGCTADACNGDGSCSHTIAAGSCVINGACYVSGASNPADSCQICDPAKATTWSNQADGTSCNDSSACTGVDGGSNSVDGGAACASHTCIAGTCKGVCVPGKLGCNGQTAQSCDATGNWQEVMTCVNQACVEGACQGVCTPGNQQCSGQTPQICDATGAWQDGAACANQACVAGTCQGACTPGAKQCSGQTAQLCDATGAWQNLESCDDGNPCTVDACSVGVCVHTASPAGTSCDDGNACNGAEKCDEAGHCQAGTPVVCTAQDQCHIAGTCDSATGLCTSPAQPNGTSCDDVNPCTKTDVCTAGACGGTAYTCDDGKTCTADSCNGDGTCTFTVTADNCLVDGTCYASATTNPANQCEQCAPETSKTAWSPKSGGTACDDGNACTKGDVCDGASLCGGTAYTCSDGLACTADACNGDGTCSFAIIVGNCVIAGACYAAGATNPANQCQTCAPGISATSWTAKSTETACNDGNACTSNDMCSAGVCAGTAYSCDDGLGCTADSCNGDGGCNHTIAAGSCVIDGACHASGASNPADSCQICDPAKATTWSNQADGTSCNDSSACTGVDGGSNSIDGGVACGSHTCIAGTCKGICAPGKLGCNGQTAQSCDATGNWQEVMTCVNQACVEGACQGVCTPGNQQCSGQTPQICDATGAWQDGAACANQACVAGTCQGACTPGAQQCSGQTPQLCDATGAWQNLESCDDGNPCTVDACSVGVCVHTASPTGTSCDDGNACNGAEKCDGTGYCQAGTPVVCTAQDQCHIAGICDPSTGVCSSPAKADGSTCSDGSACTIGDVCQAGGCVAGSAVACTALDQCHNAGVCDPRTGACSNPSKLDGTSCDDGNKCTTGDTCVAGACTAGAPIVCIASGTCHTAGTCDPSSGACTNPAAPDGTTCDDGNKCTVADVCASGVCTSGTPVTCAASDACHVAGICNSTTGVCSNPVAANGTVCNDGNACTQTDQCQSGSCVGSNMVTCLAPDQCHQMGACAPATGACVYPLKANGVACNDGNACTQADACQAGICVGTNPKTCSEGNQCQDTGLCDSSTGNCLFPGKADGIACDDGDATTSSDACHAGVCIGIPEAPAPTPSNVATSLSFIYQGSGASQTGVASGTIQAYRAAGIRGHVFTRDGLPLLGAKVTVVGHSEYGQVLSRADGGYDLVVNGGGTLTIAMAKPGYLPVDRPVAIPWQGFAHVDDVVMVQVDSQVTTVDLTQATQQVALGSVSSDGDGTRQAVLVVPAGTQALMDLPNGTTVALNTLGIHITEVTQGANGPSAMPAPLPANTQYTYAVDYSTDEALAANAKAIRFTKPIYHYSENFVGFPVGMGIPAGYYDRTLHAWVPMQNGAVVKVLAIANGMAQLDVDGSGNPAASDWRQAMGITDAELSYVAQRYPPGQTLWRVPVPHFTFVDYNLAGGPPPGAGGPQAAAPSDNPDSPSNQVCGSIIEAQHQIVGERIPVAGTPFTLNYRSNRVEGFAAARALDLSLSGASVPDTLLGIKLKAQVAGQTFTADLPPTANSYYPFLWDGKDASARTVNGRQVAQVSVGYEYPVQYYRSTDALYHTAIDFGKLGSTLVRSGVYGREHMITWKDLPTSTTTVGTYLANSAKMGAWTLDVSHTYDLQHTLWRGDGERERSQIRNSASGTIIPSSYSNTLRLAPGADGGLYITGGPQASSSGTPNTDVLSLGTIWKVDRALARSLFFTLARVPAAENGPYGNWYQRQVMALAAAPDESLYFSANTWVYSGLSARYIDHVGRDGSFIASWKVIDASSVGEILSMVAAVDGLYYADVRNTCLRLMRLTPDGQISQVAGGDCTNLVAGGDGGAAINATFKAVSGAVDLAIGPDGAIYVANQSECRVRRIDTDGSINTVAGTTCPAAEGHTGDGGPASAAKINPTSITVGQDNTLYIGDADCWEVNCPIGSTGCTDWGSGNLTQPRSRIRTVSNGVINSVAGAKTTFAPLGSPAGQISLGTLNDMVLLQDAIWYVESAVGNITGATWPKPDTFPNAVRRLSAAGPGLFVSMGIRVPSQDGSEIYEFNSDGVHLRTLDSLTGAVRYQFGYGSDGMLTSVTDANNLVTSIVRDGSGVATAIVAPNGQQTTLGYGNGGYLATLDQPGEIHHEFTYSNGGLLHTFQNPNGNVSTFGYDDLGRVTSEQMPGGCSWTLTRTGPTATDIKAPVQVSVTSAEGRTRRYTIGEDDSGTENRTNLSAAGLTTTIGKTQAGVETQATPDGMTSTGTAAPDPRGGMQAPIPASTVVKTPSGTQRTVNMSRASTTDTTGQNLVSQVDTTTVNGKTSTSTYNAAAKTVTSVSPVGRQTVSTLDDKGRVVQVQTGSLAPTAYAYDNRGRLSTVTVGTGTTARVTTFGYDDLDRLQTVTDPLLRTQSYAYDDANRVTTQTFTDGNSVVFGYDANGNVTSVTPPGRTAHAFGFTPNDLMSSYTPPLMSTEAPTTYEYNLDKQPTVIHRPDGSTINFTYDSAGRLATTTYPSVNGNVVVTRTYSPTTGKLTGVTTSDGQSLAFGYDGSLVTSTTWSGNVAGSVSRTFNNDFRVATELVNGANSVAFGYDNDGLLTSVDGLSITRDPTNGLITDTTLGSVTDHRTYDSFGMLSTDQAKFGTTSLYSASFDFRDSLGRIEQKTETIQGTTTVWNYTYDTAGRLWQVMQNGVLTATYLYDANGNRLSKTTASGTESGTYDAQDRLLTYGRWSYTYTANGDLLTKTDTSTGQVTNYSYDAQGNLRHVGLPDGRSIDYVIDSENRRVAKKINGAVVRKWIYKDDLKPVAEFDGAGALLARYLDGVTVKGSTSYRVVSDHLGTPRLLVNSTTGAIAQRLDLDEWGQVTADSSAGFQVFGFAGGIYDPDTGLVRFGARDYDPIVGRWTAKDPIRFEGGQPNIYVYVWNSPLSVTDPTGKDYALMCVYMMGKAAFSCTTAWPYGQSSSGASCEEATRAWIDACIIPTAQRTTDAAGQCGHEPDQWTSTATQGSTSTSTSTSTGAGR